MGFPLNELISRHGLGTGDLEPDPEGSLVSKVFGLGAKAAGLIWDLDRIWPVTPNGRGRSGGSGPRDF
jgi:hypothetical protein